MGKNAPIPRRYPPFGRNDLAGLRHDVRFGSDATAVAGDRSREVGFGLEGSESGSRGHKRVASAPGRAVDQGHRPAVHGSHWVEQVVAGLTVESRETVADLDQPERQGTRDRRVRQVSLDDGLQDLPAGQLGDLRRLRYAVPMNR